MRASVHLLYLGDTGRIENKLPARDSFLRRALGGRIPGRQFQIAIMGTKKIAKILEKEPAFRLKQIKKAVFGDLIENWDEITTLPSALRQHLQDCCPIQELAV